MGRSFGPGSPAVAKGINSTTSETSNRRVISLAFAEPHKLLTVDERVYLPNSSTSIAVHCSLNLHSRSFIV